MYHYVKNIVHPHTMYSTIKYGLADTGASSTYIRQENPHENTHKLGHTIFFVGMRQLYTIKHSMHTSIAPVVS